MTIIMSSLSHLNFFLIFLYRRFPGVLVRAYHLFTSLLCVCCRSSKRENIDQDTYESPVEDAACVSHSSEQNIIATASDRLSATATSVSTLRVGVNPSFAMPTATSPFGFTDGAASHVDVSITPSLAMVRMTNPFGVIGVAASYVDVYTSPSFAMLAMVIKPPAEPEDNHSSDSDVSKSLSLLYNQLSCTSSREAPNIEVADESAAVDSKESALVSRSGEYNIIATPRKRLSSTATSVSPLRVGITPSFAMFSDGKSFWIYRWRSFTRWRIHQSILGYG